MSACRSKSVLTRTTRSSAGACIRDTRLVAKQGQSKSPRRSSKKNNSARNRQNQTSSPSSKNSHTRTQCADPVALDKLDILDSEKDCDMDEKCQDNNIDEIDADDSDFLSEVEADAPFSFDGMTSSCSVEHVISVKTTEHCTATITCSERSLDSTPAIEAETNATILPLISDDTPVQSCDGEMNVHKYDIPSTPSTDSVSQDAQPGSAIADDSKADTDEAATTPVVSVSAVGLNNCVTDDDPFQFPPEGESIGDKKCDDLKENVEQSSPDNLKENQTEPKDNKTGIETIVAGFSFISFASVEEVKVWENRRKRKERELEAIRANALRKARPGRPITVSRPKPRRVRQNRDGRDRQQILSDMDQTIADVASKLLSSEEIVDEDLSQVNGTIIGGEESLECSSFSPSNNKKRKIHDYDAFLPGEAQTSISSDVASSSFDETFAAVIRASKEVLDKEHAAMDAKTSPRQTSSSRFESISPPSDTASASTVPAEVKSVSLHQLGPGRRGKWNVMHGSVAYSIKEHQKAIAAARLRSPETSDLNNLTPCLVPFRLYGRYPSKSTPVVATETSTAAAQLRTAVSTSTSQNTNSSLSSLPPSFSSAHLPTVQHTPTNSASTPAVATGSSLTPMCFPSNASSSTPQQHSLADGLSIRRQNHIQLPTVSASPITSTYNQHSLDPSKLQPTQQASANNQIQQQHQHAQHSAGYLHAQNSSDQAFKQMQQQLQQQQQQQKAAMYPQSVVEQQQMLLQQQQLAQLLQTPLGMSSDYAGSGDLVRYLSAVQPNLLLSLLMSEQQRQQQQQQVQQQQLSAAFLSAAASGDQHMQQRVAAAYAADLARAVPSASAGVLPQSQHVQHPSRPSVDAAGASSLEQYALYSHFARQQQLQQQQQQSPYAGLHAAAGLDPRTMSSSQLAALYQGSGASAAAAAATSSSNFASSLEALAKASNMTGQYTKRQ